MRRVTGGFVVGGFTDHHVHLQLVDASALANSPLGRVIDLGGNPDALAAARTQPTAEPVEARERLRNHDRLRDHLSAIGIELAFAGAFLTPPGGYPSDRSWAPEGSVREIADADAAARAVVEMEDAGATCIKVASNSTAGPVFSDELFARIVELAASHRLPLVAHAEGPGEAQRVARLGGARLAHAPFSERLSDAEIDEQAASIEWISTLAIHEGEAYDVAVDNVRRFHAAGGTVLYGSDMGNGPTPVGLNPHEIAALRDAGIDGDDLVYALSPVAGTRLQFIPGDSPDVADPLLAHPLTDADLEA